MALKANADTCYYFALLSAYLFSCSLASLPICEEKAVNGFLWLKLRILEAQSRMTKTNKQMKEIKHLVIIGA